MIATVENIFQVTSEATENSSAHAILQAIDSCNKENCESIFSRAEFNRRFLFSFILFGDLFCKEFVTPSVT